MRRIGMLFLVVVLLLNSLFFDHAVVQAEPAAPADVPTALVGSGVGNYSLVSPKLFWHTPVPPCPPADASGAASPRGSVSRDDQTHCHLRQHRAHPVFGHARLQSGPDPIQPGGRRRLYLLADRGRAGEAFDGCQPRRCPSAGQRPGQRRRGGSRRQRPDLRPLRQRSQQTDRLRLEIQQPACVLWSWRATASDMQIDGKYVYYRTNASALVRINPGVSNRRPSPPRSQVTTPKGSV